MDWVSKLKPVESHPIATHGSTQASKAASACSGREELQRLSAALLDPPRNTAHYQASKPLPAPAGRAWQWKRRLVMILPVTLRTAMVWVRPRDRLNAASFVCIAVVLFSSAYGVPRVAQRGDDASIHGTEARAAGEAYRGGANDAPPVDHHWVFQTNGSIGYCHMSTIELLPHGALAVAWQGSSGIEGASDQVRAAPAHAAQQVAASAPAFFKPTSGRRCGVERPPAAAWRRREIRRHIHMP